MARIKIEMPAIQLAEVTVPVRISDVNYGNHVGNDAFVSIIHEARLQWLLQKGQSEYSFFGNGLILGDLAVEFKKEAFHGDIITVSVFAGELSRVSFDLYYQLAVMRNGKTIVLANAKTGMVCFDYAVKKPVALQEDAKKLLSGG